jgi:hypothetical protein
VNEAHESSSSVEATVGVEGSYRLASPAPNPFRRQVQFHITLGQTQPVRVELFDLLSRRMQGPRDGNPAGQVRHSFAIDGQQMPSGAYMGRVRSRDVNPTRRVMLAREPPTRNRERVM